MKKIFILFSMIGFMFLSACGSKTDMPDPDTVATKMQKLTDLPFPTSIIPTETLEPIDTIEPDQTANSEVATSEPTQLLSALNPDLLWLPILEALAKGLVELEISGDGLEEIDVVLNPNIEASIGVAFTPGIIFETNSDGVQPMLLIEFREVIMKPNIEVELELDVACADMSLKAPEESDTFTISQTEIFELSRLAWKISEHSDMIGFRPKQFAVWVITNDPKREEMRGLTAGFSPYGSGPGDEEISIMRGLFLAADIAYEDYQFFNDL